MRMKKQVSEELKNKPVVKNRTGDKDSVYDDIRMIREIMRKSASSRPNLYVPKETRWHRFARRSEESQK